MITADCISGTISPYVPSASRPWNQQRAMHMARRLGYGLSPDELTSLLTSTPTQWISAEISKAQSLPLEPTPYWVNYSEEDFENAGLDPGDVGINWVAELLLNHPENGLRDKMVLFWSNHFVTEYESYNCPSFAFHYVHCLQKHALGNFRDFVYDIGKTQAMLVYLNGAQNNVTSPNENYARELYELFTLGRDNNYTQTDIQETARALTGWTLDLNDEEEYCGNGVVFYNLWHDKGDKTIFGQTGKWGYDQVIDILFTQRKNEIAQHICHKLYAFFVHPNPDPNIVNEMVSTFLDNDFAIAPVLNQLFRSEHFFDDEVIGTQIKSPLELQLTFNKELGIPLEDNEEGGIIIWYQGSELGQAFLNPVDVAGWPGYRDWISTSQLTLRWQTLMFYLYYGAEQHPELLPNFAKKLTNNSNDVNYIVQTIIDYFLPKGLQRPEEYERAVTIFKADIPQNYFIDKIWNLDWEEANYQLALLIGHIVRQPEFQLY